MIKYKFNNGFNRFEVEFEFGWQRFHSCKAATWYGSPMRYDKYNFKGDRLTQDTWILVSYATPIAIATEYLDFHHKGVSVWHLHINEDAWNCSNSTIHHLARFLAEIKFPYYSGSSPYYLVKKIMQRMERMETTYYRSESGNLTICAETPRAMDLTLRDLNIPAYYVRSI